MARLRRLRRTAAVQLSGFTTQSLVGHLGRTPDQVGLASAQIIEAVLAAGLTQRQRS